MKGLLVDLRENPGGLLTAVCDTLEQILPKGMIVYTEDKSGHRTEHTCKGKTPIDIPLVVLVNENSASAAEIFSGAVKDHGVGTLVGTTTFGKGIVQQTFSLGDGSAVKLTTSRYYTPNGVNIQGTGITPDVESDWPENAEEFTNPNQFNELSQEEWESKDAQMKKQERFFRKRLHRQNSDGKMKKMYFGSFPVIHKSAGRTEYGKICNYDREYSRSALFLL